MKKQKQTPKVEVDFSKLKDKLIQIEVPDAEKFMKIVGNAYIDFNAKISGVKGRIKIRCSNPSAKNGIKPLQIDVEMIEANIRDIVSGRKSEIFVESSVGSVALNIIGVG